MNQLFGKNLRERKREPRESKRKRESSTVLLEILKEGQVEKLGKVRNKSRVQELIKKFNH
ncbi:unnamed protein product [Camellia sinensis]